MSRRNPAAGIRHGRRSVRPAPRTGSDCAQARWRPSRVSRRLQRRILWPEDSPDSPPCALRWDSVSELRFQAACERLRKHFRHRAHLRPRRRRQRKFTRRRRVVSPGSGGNAGVRTPAGPAPVGCRIRPGGVAAGGRIRRLVSFGYSRTNHFFRHMTYATT